MLDVKIGFLGAGRMATALASGWIQTGLLSGDRLLAADPSPQAAESFSHAAGGKLLEDNAAVADAADVLVLAVKPQYMSVALDQVRSRLSDRHLLISIAAGVRLETIRKAVGRKPRLVRVMPNTPCLVGQSASGFALEASGSQEDADLVEQLLSAVGVAYRLEESLLDAVTGLSGSGPALVYVMIEALSDGGVRMGLPRNVATALAAQTVKGAAEMVLQTGEHPAALKDQVTSPGGTTIAGLQTLEQGAVRAALMGAVESATRRSIELSQLG